MNKINVPYRLSIVGSRHQNPKEAGHNGDIQSFSYATTEPPSACSCHSQTQARQRSEQEEPTHDSDSAASHYPYPMPNQPQDRQAPLLSRNIGLSTRSGNSSFPVLPPCLSIHGANDASDETQKNSHLEQLLPDAP